jgi:hypothetical protein
VLVRDLALGREELVTWMVTSTGVVEFETETSFEAFETSPSQGQLFLY